jgi:hypothetical protein
VRVPDLPEWLAVDAEDGVIDPYRLLGLSPGEPDVALIRQAIDRARERLEDSGSGHSADDRRALKAVLDRAEEVLTDPKHKDAYDELVRSRPGTAGASAGLRRRFSLPRLGGLPVDQRWKLAVTVAALCVSVVFGSRSVLRGPERFPKRRGGAPPVKGADMDSPRLPPPPPKPSVSGLTVGIPRKLPGLEDVTGATEPTLSADLRVLIFSREAGRSRERDLFLTTRKGPRDAFAKPQPMGAVNTAGSERSPTLSRDGLELIFLRDGRPFVTSRPSRAQRFRPPEPLSIPGVDPERESVDAPQIFADGLSVSFRVRTKGEAPDTPPRYLIAERAAPGSPFERAAPVEVWRPRMANVFSADGLRDYVGLNGGLSLATRRGLGSKFGMPGLIQRLMPSKVGPIEGPFWVTPEEDVLIFSSPGPDADEQPNHPGPPRYLWQVLIR